MGPIGLIGPISALAQTNVPTAKPPADDEIYDIRPPYFYLQSWTWLWILLAALVALALLVWLAFRLWPNRQLSPKSAYELALENLEKARGLIREDVPMPYAVKVSEVVRSYLSQRFQTPSTRRTTEEFFRLMQADPATPLAEHRVPLHEFLQSCDLVKFARHHPTRAELELVQQRAVNFVTATKPVAVTTS